MMEREMRLLEGKMSGDERAGVFNSNNWIHVMTWPRLVIIGIFRTLMSWHGGL